MYQILGTNIIFLRSMTSDLDVLATHILHVLIIQGNRLLYIQNPILLEALSLYVIPSHIGKHIGTDYRMTSSLPDWMNRSTRAIDRSRGEVPPLVLR